MLRDNKRHEEQQSQADRPDLFRSLTAHEPPLFNLLAREPQGQAVIQTVERRLSAVRELLEADDQEEAVRMFVETVAFGPGTWANIPQPVKKTVINELFFVPEKPV
jgi:hypothetical protein